MLPSSVPAAERVLLRLVTQQDALTLATLWQDEQVRAHLGGPVNKQEAMKKSHEYVCRAGAFAVAVPRSRPFGLVMVEPHASGDFEVSYMFQPQAWGHGYATNALRAVVEWSFGDAALPRLTAITQSANERSSALLARVGFRAELEFVEYGAAQTLFAAQPGSTGWVATRLSSESAVSRTGQGSTSWSWI